MVPSVGRIVHYVAHGTPVREDGTQAFPPACRAAIVTEVSEYPTGISDADKSNIAVPVSLAVLNPSGMFFHQGAMQSELDREGGSWHWPERIESFEHSGRCEDVEHPQGFAPNDK